MMYEYLCDNCELNFEIKQSIHDKPLKRCSNCKKHKLYRVIHSPYIINHTEPKTLGSQAERNTSRMGRYELEDKRNVKIEIKNNLKLPRGARRIEKPKENVAPWWRPGTSKPISLKGIKDTKRYIETGRKD